MTPKGMNREYKTHKTVRNMMFVGGVSLVKYVFNTFHRIFNVSIDVNLKYL